MNKLERAQRLAELEFEIENFVQLRDHVSFAELFNLLGDRMKGELTLTSPANENIVFWMNVSQDFSDALNHLTEGKKTVRLEPASPLVYMLDGRFPELPLVRAIRIYRRPHWLPVILRPGARRK